MMSACVLAVSMLVLPLGGASAADAHFAKEGVVIAGYATVAFHTMAKPTPG